MNTFDFKSVKRIWWKNVLTSYRQFDLSNLADTQRRGRFLQKIDNWIFTYITKDWQATMYAPGNEKVVT